MSIGRKDYNEGRNSESGSRESPKWVTLENTARCMHEFEEGPHQVNASFPEGILHLQH